MRIWMAVLTLAGCLSLLAFARPNAASLPANMTEDDFRKLEQNWLDAEAGAQPAGSAEDVRRRFHGNFLRRWCAEQDGRSAAGRNAREPLPEVHSPRFHRAHLWRHRGINGSGRNAGSGQSRANSHDDRFSEARRAMASDCRAHVEGRRVAIALFFSQQTYRMIAGSSPSDRTARILLANAREFTSLLYRSHPERSRFSGGGELAEGISRETQHLEDCSILSRPFPP